MKTLKTISIRKWVMGFLPFYLFTFLPLNAQIGSWRNYLAYSDVQQIQAAGNELFVMASNDLYQYNKVDHSIYTYDKTNGLSDTGIQFINWCQQAKRLVVVYDDSNIDLVETNGNVTNISDIYTRSITGGKEIYHVLINGQYAYLSTDFGVVKINVKQAEISETYSLGFPITATAIEGNNLYAQSKSQGIWKGNMQSNLIDPSNWTQTATAPSFDIDRTDYDNNIDLVKTLLPGGPTYNEFYEGKVVNGTFYSTGGAFRSGFIAKGNPGIVQILNGSNWTVYPTDINETTGIKYNDNNCIDVDPTFEQHVFVGGKTGLYEFQNGRFKTLWNKHNSPLKPAMNGTEELPDHYTLINGIIFDQYGNLWVLNNQANDVNLLQYTKGGEWIKHTKTELCQSASLGMSGMRCAMFDSRGLMWFVNTHQNVPAILCYDRTSDKVLRYASFVNQDGTAYDRCYPYDIKEDLKGNMWIATNKGPFYIKKEEIGQATVTLYQEKVPRNDGTDLADYLLTGLHCNTIAIDGAGRKWIGTEGYGVFLISEDNMTQLQHFTKDNSCLLSDNVNYIAINQQNGEVFFLTDKGLCSYISDATEAATEMTKETVWAYPNPVTPEYTGLITVVGLTLNADVKILSANGALIYEGRSNGGTFTWNGCDKEGRRVASGVYMVATATSSGEKGTVCKIAIVR